MFRNLATYYFENIVTPFLEYRDRSNDGIAGMSRDLRGAMCAANALFHLREHLPKPMALSRKDVERACSDYALLGDVVNVSKHGNLISSTPHGLPLVSDAANLFEKILIIEYEDNEGSYRYAQKAVVVKLSDGSDRNLLGVLTNVINFWEQHLLTIGVLTSARTFMHDANIRARSRAECETNRLDLEQVRGQNFHLTIQVLKFNYETGTAEPPSLPCKSASLRFFRPNFDVDLFLTNGTNGEEVKTTISLSEEESAAISSMSDAERQAFVYSLPSAQAALKELAIKCGVHKI
jgi:hypothetical protein